MSLWGNLDNATGNQKPVFANTSSSTSNSTINGTVANTNAYYGYMMGASPTEMTTHPDRSQHAGWTSIKYGTGPITSITATGGSGINAAGFLTFTDASPYGQGILANASFAIANSQNTLQAYSTNSSWNTISSITVVNGGSGWSNATAITIRTNGSNTTLPTFTVALGGRSGRILNETIVAMGSITGDDVSDNVVFSGV